MLPGYTRTKKLATTHTTGTRHRVSSERDFQFRADDLFAIFEAISKWCLVRACGIKTKF